MHTSIHSLEGRQSSRVRCVLPGSLVLALASSVSVLVLASSVSAQCPAWTPEFGPRGVDGAIQAMKVWDDGSGPALYVAGNFSKAGDVASPGIARWNGTTFSALPGTDGTISALEVFDDGSGPALYAGGAFTSIGGVPANNVARWNGTSWSQVGGGLGLGIVDSVNCFAVHDDGSGPALYAGGLAIGGFGEAIARLSSGLWTSVGGGFQATNWCGVFALRSHDFGGGPRLFAGGLFDSASGVATPGIASWDGVSWSSVAGGVGGANAYVTSLALHLENGVMRLFAGGTFVSAGGVTARRIARFDGTNWSAVGSGLVNGTVWSLAEHDTGASRELVVGGAFAQAGGAANRIARWSNGSWSAYGDGLGSATGTQSVLSLATFDAGAGPKLYAGGSFLSAGSIPTDGFARWEGTSWSAPVTAQGVAGTINALAVDDDGLQRSLIVGGAFDSVGPVAARSIARWDGAGWSPLGSGIAGNVYAIASGSGAGITSIFAGGDFLSAGGAPANRVARFDGASWTGLGAGADGAVYALAFHDSGAGAELHLGGVFLNAGGSSIRGVARWDGAAFHDVGGGIPGDVRALLSFDDGSGPAFYATGSFTQAGGAGANAIARWDGATWSALGTGLSGGIPSTQGRTLAVHDDGTGPALYVGGRFTHAGGQPATNVARWRNGAWSAVGTGLAPVGGEVRGLAVYDDGSGTALHAVGLFGGATALVGSARWDGAQWLPAGGPLGDPRAAHVFDDGTGPALFVGGSMLGSEGSDATGSFARWKGCYTTPAIVCVGDGSGTLCPCANHSPAGAGAGCANSFGLGGSLRAYGYPRVAHDTLVLEAEGMPNSSALYFQGTSTLGAGVVFGDGLRCAGGATRRLGIQQNANGSSSHPQPGGVPLSVGGGVPPAGGTFTYQVWYRNAAAFCSAATFNLTNGLTVVWIP